MQQPRQVLLKYRALTLLNIPRHAKHIYLRLRHGTCEEKVEHVVLQFILRNVLYKQLYEKGVYITETNDLEEAKKGYIIQ